ncbi:MerR family transcriptional regulator [Thermoleophilia bacterium SCSIO 60948]|nr:MerR family transcriptional regulator [Thermoleophilia bacterium SCSIO 60948]
MTAQQNNLSIADIAERTGVRESTLRMWERRYQFPEPRRLAGGHRRYSETDVESVRRVLAERDGGLTLSAAVERVTGANSLPRSLFAPLRETFPQLETSRMRKPMLLALTHAVEDESCARAESAVLFGAFQEERYYRAAARRWRDLAAVAEFGVAFADFDEFRPAEPGRAAEVPLEPGHPLTREWGLICQAADHSACLVAWEPPGQDGPESSRSFDVIWSVEPDVVRESARLASALVATSEPDFATELLSRIEAFPAAAAAGQLRLAAAVTRRMLADLGRG